MIVQYGLTPEQVDELPIRTLILLPIVQMILQPPGGTVTDGK